MNTKQALVVAAMIAAVPVLAASADDSLQTLTRQLAKDLPGLHVEDLKRVPGTELVEITRNGNVGYATADGRYFIRGDLIELSTRANLAEARRRAMRHDELAKLDEKDEIVFSPKNPRYTVTVFTDVDCGFCRHMHGEMAAYNAAGIAIRYVAYPATGPGTESWAKARDVWCAKDRRDALTKAKRDEPIEPAGDCNPASIQQQYELAEKFGIQGTPLLVLEDGRRVDGYQSPAQLLATIESKDDKPRPAAAAGS